MSRPSHVFIGGLHRSGTSLVARLLAAHPEVTGFENTGVWEDEGQHLQDSIPPGRALGGPGRFGHHPDAHLTERSRFAVPETRAALDAAWEPHWGSAPGVKLEKSPPNLLRFRLLQHLYPDAAFVAVVRHPAIVALATRRMRRAFAFRSVPGLIDHWLQCHAAFEGDRREIARLSVVRYESLVADPTARLARLHRFLELSPAAPTLAVSPEPQAFYASSWGRWLDVPLLGGRRRAALAPRARAAAPFGYDLFDPRPPAEDAVGPPLPD